MSTSVALLTLCTSIALPSDARVGTCEIKSQHYPNYPKTQPNHSDRFLIVFIEFNHQSSFVKKLDNAIHWINLYPMDNFINFPNTYFQDSDSSGGYIALSDV